jgi:hypothetical protein
METTTKYAPVSRKTSDKIEDERNSLMNITYLKGLLDALPNLSAILNEERQALYVNQSILDLLGIGNLSEVMGERPGEIFGCIHSQEEPGGCGTSESCKLCGAANCILKSQVTQSRIVDECRISSVIGGKNRSFDLQITAAPANFGGNTYTILTLNDISNLKRKQILEKLFFHDILNISHNLKGFIDLMLDLNDPKELRSFLEQISSMVSQLNDEIISQRELIAAEKGELNVNLSIFNLSDYLRELVRGVNHHDTAIGKEIYLCENESSDLLCTDRALLSRVLINMIKNALEAEPVGSKVSIGSQVKEGFVYLWVKNSTVLSDNVKMQIFQRSFSTKGPGRGIGTYSMKLISGQYLKGTISFISTKIEGTIFTLKLPQNYPVFS